MDIELSVFAYNDYICFLEDLLSKRREESIEYTQLEFAHDLGMSPPRISQVLKRKEGISVKRAKEIVESFEFSEKESEYFFHLISSKTSKSQKQKENSKQFILENHKRRVPHYLTMENWSLLDVEGWDIVWNLIEINSDFSDLNKISEICKISIPEVENILQAMQNLELIKREEEKIVKLKNHISFGNSISSSSIRNHHKRKIINSLRALDLQGQDTRKNETMTFTMNKKNFQVLSSKIEIFMDNFLNDIDEQDHDEVSTLNISMFSCTK